MEPLLLLNYILSSINIILLLRVLLSWFVDVRNPLYNALVVITEPILSPVRKLIDKSAVSRSIPFDLSPIVVFFIIWFIQSLIR